MRPRYPTMSYQWYLYLDDIAVEMQLNEDHKFFLLLSAYSLPYQGQIEDSKEWRSTLLHRTRLRVTVVRF